MLTGSIMILACFAYGVIILNDPKMKIPFANPDDQVVFIDPQFGWSWYLPLFTGIGTLVLGTVVLIMDYFLPRKIAIVFHHSVVEEDEFFAVSELYIISDDVIIMSLYDIQEDEDDDQTGKVEDYPSVRTRRGGTTRSGRTTRRGLSRLRKTERKPRSTVRSNRGGSQHLAEEGAIPLTEIPAKES